MWSGALAWILEEAGGGQWEGWWRPAIKIKHDNNPSCMCGFARGRICTMRLVVL